MLYYLHGYQSSPMGQKATLFKETLHAIPITYRENAPEDLVISRCLSQISEAITQDCQVILIGSSLGGFLAASTALTHPNVTPHPPQPRYHPTRAGSHHHHGNASENLTGHERFAALPSEDPSKNHDPARNP